MEEHTNLVNQGTVLMLDRVHKDLQVKYPKSSRTYVAHACLQSEVFVPSPANAAMCHLIARVISHECCATAYRLKTRPCRRVLFKPCKVWLRVRRGVPTCLFSPFRLHSSKARACPALCTSWTEW